MNDHLKIDVIVVGGGHAGCEASLACSRLGLRVLLFVMNMDTIGQMSCNPAIGGLAKGQLVREIDALGGQMAINADNTGIQFKMLNRSKGPAVWSLRCQSDKYLYKRLMKSCLENQYNLHVKQAEVVDIIIENGSALGIKTSLGSVYESKAVILTTGTFLNGLIHTGDINYPGGRFGDSPSLFLSKSLLDAGIRLGRFKTGTPPRLDGNTIDFDQMLLQSGDDRPEMFSLSSKGPLLSQIPCYRTATTTETHQTVRSSLSRSPLYSGRIKGVGPRYCPSIEDKVVRFSEKPSHPVFIEPEGLESKEYYANGISTSLPLDVQESIVRSIPGLRHAEISRPGYAIEYDYADPRMLFPSLESKVVKNLFLAGQINGTSGYEEAAAQGLMAGINASLRVFGQDPLVLRRSEAYIGVMIDDLVTLGTVEPYRMFTSRAEHRLFLRQDNAEDRLAKYGIQIGLLSGDRENGWNELQRQMKLGRDLLERLKVKKGDSFLLRLGAGTVGASFGQILKRPEISIDELLAGVSEGDSLGVEARKRLQVEFKYSGYIERQNEAVVRFQQMEDKRIPNTLDFRSVGGLSRELVEKLDKIRPLSVGQASRIPGITPSAIAALLVVLKKQKHAFS